MWIRKKEDEARSLHEEALARLDAGELDAAESLGRRLEAMGWTGAYEVLALARRRRGDLAGAIAALDEGTAVAPEAWLLHQLRGNLLDEAGRSEDALEAFETALACPDAWVSSVRFNRAVARLRAGDPGGALADAEHVLTEGSSPPFAGEALEIAVDALVALNRSDDAVAIVDHVLSAAEPAGPEVVGALHGTRARALLAAGRDEREVRDACTRAIEGGSGSARVAQVLRGLLEDDGAPRRRHRVVLEVPTGEQAGGGEAAGYLRVLSVVAADEGEARSLAASLEPVALRARSSIHEISDEGPAVGPAHVMPLSGRIHFGG
jgi:tetratricopeptide (TPR) repeat protein